MRRLFAGLLYAGREYLGRLWRAGTAPPPPSQPQIIGLLWDYPKQVVLEWDYPKAIALVWED